MTIMNQYKQWDITVNNQVFQRKTRVIKLMNVGGRAGG